MVHALRPPRRLQRDVPDLAAYGYSGGRSTIINPGFAAWSAPTNILLNEDIRLTLASLSFLRSPSPLGDLLGRAPLLNWFRTASSPTLSLPSARRAATEDLFVPAARYSLSISWQQRHTQLVTILRCSLRPGAVPLYGYRLFVAALQWHAQPVLGIAPIRAGYAERQHLLELLFDQNVKIDEAELYFPSCLFLHALVGVGHAGRVDHQNVRLVVDGSYMMRLPSVHVARA